MAQYFNISGELTQQLLAPCDNVNVSKISLTNIQKVSKCKVDLYVEKKLTGKFYILKNIELPKPKTVEIPTLYGGEYGPDIEFVANNAKLSIEEVINIHTKNHIDLI